MSGSNDSTHDASKSWIARSATYGRDHTTLWAYITSLKDKLAEVEVIEVWPNGKPFTKRSTVPTLMSTAKNKVVSLVFTDTSKFREYLIHEVNTGNI